jgi:hypothetical protein
MNRKKRSLYWQCQLIGWTMASLYWSLSGFISGGFSITLALVHLFTDITLYIGITHLYRNFSLHHQWQQLALKPLLLRLFPAAIVLACAYTVVTLLKIYLVRLVFVPGFSQSFSGFIADNILGVSMAGMRLMSIWLLAYHGYHYAIREMRLVHENDKLLLSLKEAQLQNLSSQLNPHFLFNALNTIKALVVTQPLSARRGIDLLGELLRTGLYEGGQPETTVQAELSLVQDYLELEQLRMEDRLSYEISIPGNLYPLAIPRLSLTTLAENAVKHGIAQNKTGGKVFIGGAFRENGYCLSVTHPGILGNGEGIGIRNLQERLQILYKGKAFFEIYSEDGMVKASLFIPQ